MWNILKKFYGTVYTVTVIDARGVTVVVRTTSKSEADALIRAAMTK